MVEESVRKTATKKTVRKAVGRTAAVTRAPRTRKRAGEETESTPVARPRRKAPTKVAATIVVDTRSKRIMYVGIGVFVLLFVAGTVIGFTDRGVINVKSIIETRILAASPEERARLEQAQKSTANNLVDGGLIASGVPETPPEPVATTSAETATSTEAVASSTDEAITEETETPAAQENGGLVPTDTPAE
jgi:hypothetical protein